MARRRGAPSSNSLSPPDIGVPSTSPSTGFLNFPRSASPSSGFTQFLSKPTKWFNRSSSTGNVAGRSSTSSMEPRPSTSSSGRKPKISHPTDPRPIVDSLHPDSGLTGASRSVLDLSLARTATTFETHHGGYTSHTAHTSHTPRAPSSPSHPAYSKGLGDLRNISRKPWSKSADDLGKMPHAISPTLSPIDTAFQGKIEQYRNNRNDSVSSSNLPSPSTSPAPSIHKGYPFPTTVATEALSSSPPQMLGVLNPATSSASGGNSPVTPGSGGHVHSRSHSFTPRLPSKLSAPKLGGLAPASPKRKGSASSEVELNKERTNRMEEKDKNGSTGSLGAGPSPRPGFPFNFVNGSGSSKSLSPLNTDMGPSSGEKASPSSALLAPPTIIEPGADLDFKHEKRTSQVIYHSGFINRMADFNPALMNARANHSYMSGSGAPALAKGWKPFKLVMKGSKLYFYKPPSDRSNAIKDLFPTELVVVLEDEGVTEEPEPQENEMEEMPVMKAREKDEGRRRRAYWGRGTHPSLVYNKSGIERGTFEALVHEAVFGTTFLLMPVAGNTTAGASEDHAPSRYRPDWHDFSATVLLTLPVLVGRSQFEAEFFRCCTLLVDGADDDCKEDEVSRVCWLATQYLAYFESPVDTVAWEVWRKNIIPDFPSCSPAKSKTAGFPQSSSMQALYTTSPMLTPSPRKPGTEFSPNLGAFSPRPDGNDRMASLMDALGDTRSMRSPSSKPVKAWRIVLDRTGLTRDVLLNLDAQLVARSLYVFHQQELQHVPENVTAECWFEVESEEPSPEAASHSAVPGSGAAQMPPPATLKLFFGSEEHPHWLTKIVLLQILISDSAGRPANGTSSLGYGAEDRLSSQTSRTHSRSDVIVAWARIGEVCRRTGDECSWRAIFAALCSRPIARLEKVWKRVDGDAVRTIHSWVHPHHGDVSDVEIKAIPWAGDCIVQSREALDSARAEEGNEWNVTFLMQCRQHFETLRTDFSLCPKKVDVPDGGESEDVLALMAHWRQLSDGGNTAGGIASKFNRIDQFMSLSLAAEPRRRGSFEPYFWTRPSPNPLFHPLTPLLFPEPLPTVAFLNRALLARSRAESGASANNVRDVQYLRELSALSSTNRRILLDTVKMGGLDLGGTVINLYDGELTLLVQPGVESILPSQPSSRAPSRPPSSHGHSSIGSPEKTLSRNPSMRVKAGASPGLERKASQMRRNSLPSLSRKPSFITEDVASDRPLRVVVQAGTLDRLVDILVEGLHGVSVSVADDNGEMPLNNGKTRELRVDSDEYASVWWSTFRSFVTPNVFFELLRKRYLGAPAKAQSSPSGDLSLVIRIRSEVFDAMTKWVHSGGGSQDTLDDSQLYHSVISFLTHEPDHVLPDVDGDLDAVASGSTLLDNMRKSLLSSFKAETMRPSQSRTGSLIDRTTRRRSTPSFGPNPPNIDDIGAEDLVSNLDAMASAAFRNVTQEDLFVTADILEVQSADRTGWFPSREPNSISDEVEIQCIHSYVHEVEPSPMISELGQDSLYRLLPPAVRGCIRAFAILRKWLVSKLVAFKIGFRTRQARMELILRAIEVCRLRNAESGFPELLPSERPCVRSFVEAILSAALLSVESRMYHRAWQLVAGVRGTPCDSLSALLNRSSMASLKCSDTLTMDMGWVLEKMLEVISMPDVIESGAQDSLSLVNFDKRRSLNGLITSAVPGGHNKRVESPRQDFERLNHIEQELNHLRFDLRSIREDAYRESTLTGPPLAKRSPRPFQTLVLAQQEKNKRDKALRDRLSKEKRLEQHRQDKREEYLNKAMHLRRPPLATPKSHRNKKSMSSAFLHFMRPISSAFTSETTSFSTVKRTPAELDFSPSHKPTIVLSIADARVSQFINNERSFTFQMDTEDGGHYLLQALNKAEMKKWMETIDRISKSAAKRRLTYLGNSSKVQLSDHLLTPGAASRDPRAVFGIDLEFLLEREGGGQAQPGAIPSVINKLILEVESRGLTEIGIYRVAGAHSEVNSLKDALNRGEWPIDRYTDINAVCDLIKAWFRVLPSGMFPASTYPEILDVAAQENVDLQTKVLNVRRIVRKLPGTHFPLLKRLMEHLDKVTDFEEQNQMTSDSLSTVFSPNLLRSSNNDIGFFFANMSSAHRAVKMLITHFHTIFDDVEQDPDAEHDAESEGEEEYEQLDEPIPEEDEEEDILSAGHESPVEDDEENTTHVRSASSTVAPVLDVNFPTDTWISIPS